MTAPGRPIRFLGVVALLWVGGRVVTVWPEAAEALAELADVWTYARPLEAAPSAEPVTRGRTVRVALADPAPAAVRVAMLAPVPVAPAERSEEPAQQPVAVFQPALVPPAAAVRPASRLSVSSWAIVRPGGGQGSLAGGGQLGASQAGIRARYALTSAVAIAARLSAPLNGSGREAALGVEWKPVRRLPLWLAAERRVREGRDAFAVGAYGGIDGVALPARFLLDAYGQAGMVGLKAKRGYVDGAVRVERAVLRRERASLSLGGGVWGAAQPGAARLDVGPQLVARVPLGITTVRAGLDWRHRIAGSARPGSGPALSVGADF